jgi:hypothetical protein
MRHRWFVIAVFSATIGPGITSGSVRAQQGAPPTPAQQPAPSAPAAAQQVDQRPCSVIDFGSNGSPQADPHEAAASAAASHRPLIQWWESRPKPVHEWLENRPKPILEAIENHPKPIHDWWRDYPKGCWSHHNACMCGSFHSELTFIFGSCRDFFGEPCLSGPPRTVYPGAYDRTLFPKMSRQPDGTQPPVPGQPPGPPTGYPNGGPTVGYGPQGAASNGVYLPPGYGGAPGSVSGPAMPPGYGPQGGAPGTYPPQGYNAPAYPEQRGVPGCSRCQ